MGDPEGGPGFIYTWTPDTVIFQHREKQEIHEYLLIFLSVSRQTRFVDNETNQQKKIFLCQ